MNRRKQMKYILILVLGIMLGNCSGMSIGKKCVYTQEGTKVWSWLWVYKDGPKPADIQKINCT